MEKVICIPDSFKGTISSLEVCEILRERLASHFPSCETVVLPVADGGEGSVDCFLKAIGGEKVSARTVGPFFEEMQGYYGLIESGKTAVIEVASCAGLPMIEGCENPMLTTTYGVGLMMLDAAQRGVSKILLAVGGSCTNDAGCGAAAACGVRFLDSMGRGFTPVGGTLERVAQIDVSHLNPVFKDIEIVTMYDIDNTMHGKTGAAWVYGPQKGADEAMVLRLDSGLQHLARIISRDLSLDVSNIPGGAAAGAMGAGMVAFMGSKLLLGIDFILDMMQFDRVCENADLVITGEGRLDRQSLRGKVISGVAKRAQRAGVPVIAVVGGYDADIDAIYDLGVSAIFSISRLPQNLEESRGHSAQNLSMTADNIFRFHKAMCAKPRLCE